MFNQIRLCESQKNLFMKQLKYYGVISLNPIQKIEIKGGNPIRVVIGLVATIISLGKNWEIGDLLDICGKLPQIISMSQSIRLSDDLIEAEMEAEQTEIANRDIDDAVDSFVKNRITELEQEGIDSGIAPKDLDTAAILAQAEQESSDEWQSIYDELFDSSFDEKGIELVTQILQERTEELDECSIVISHRKESIKAVTGEVIFIEKKQGISRRVDYNEQ